MKKHLATLVREIQIKTAVRHTRIAIIIRAVVLMIVLGMEKFEKLVVVYLLSHVQLFRDPMDCSPSGSSLCGIFRARILEWVAISSSREKLEPSYINSRNVAGATT